jgi:Polyketide cyclase / dehydrase and lipid transport
MNKIAPGRNSDMTTISHEIRINASMADVFKTISTVDGLKGWYTTRIEGDMVPGKSINVHADGRPSFRWRISELSPQTATKWECVEGPGTASGATVAFRLSTKDSRTQVQLECEGLPEDNLPSLLATPCGASCWATLNITLKRVKPSPAFTDFL